MERGAESFEGTIVGGHLVGFWPSQGSLPRGREGQRRVALVSLSTRRWSCRLLEGRGSGRVLGYWLLADARRSTDGGPLPEIEASGWCQNGPSCWSPNRGLDSRDGDDVGICPRPKWL